MICLWLNQNITFLSFHFVPTKWKSLEPYFNSTVKSKDKKCLLIYGLFYTPQLHTNCNRTCLLHSFVEMIPRSNPSNCRHKHREQSKIIGNKTTALVVDLSSRYPQSRFWSFHLCPMHPHPQIFLRLFRH